MVHSLLYNWPNPQVKGNFKLTKSGGFTILILIMDSENSQDMCWLCMPQPWRSSRNNMERPGLQCSQRWFVVRWCGLKAGWIWLNVGIHSKLGLIQVGEVKYYGHVPICSYTDLCHMFHCKYSSLITIQWKLLKWWYFLAPKWSSHGKIW